MKVVRFDESQEYHAPQQPYRRTRVIIDEATIGRKDLVVGYSIYAPGQTAPYHVHKGSETMFFVHGQGRFSNKQMSVTVKAGDVLYFDPGEEHNIEAISSQTLEFIYIYSQPGDEHTLKTTWIPVDE